jgi:hypothetical protein
LWFYKDAALTALGTVMWSASPILILAWTTVSIPLALLDKHS